jgi:ABC-type thiamine transport system, ATPase component
MLDVINVQFGYSKSADFNFSYKFDLNLPVVIHGPSGSGKSTFLNIISGLVTPFSGSIKYEGQDLFELSPAERPLSILFQRGNLFDHISCFRNVEIGLNSKVDKDYSKGIIEEIFNHLGISPLLNKLPSEDFWGAKKESGIS